MILTQQQIKDLIDGKEIQSRVLVKEEEHFKAWKTKFFAKNDILKSLDKGAMVFIRNKKINSKDRIKWQVGKDYAVQEGKKGLWWCTFCKGIETPNRKNELEMFNHRCTTADMKPLRIRITKIEKQKLHDITSWDAHKEGFKMRDDFLSHFYKTNRIPHFREKAPMDFGYGSFNVETEKHEKLEQDYVIAFDKKYVNPEVWMRTLKVKG